MIFVNNKQNFFPREYNDSGVRRNRWKKRLQEKTNEIHLVIGAALLDIVCFIYSSRLLSGFARLLFSLC